MTDSYNFKNWLVSQDNCNFSFESFDNCPYFGKDFNNNFIDFLNEEEEEEKIYRLELPHISEKKTDCDDKQNNNNENNENNTIKSKELKSSSENINQEMEIENEIFIISPNNNNIIIPNELNNENPITQSAQNTRETKHTKYEDDNMRRKCKHIILDNLLYFINYKIRIFYDNKIGQGALKKELKTLNQKQKSESNIQFNKEFLYKTIGEIFSDKISGRLTNFSPDHNKKLVESLINEKDIKKKVYFNNLFSLTFLQCLGHFIGTEYHQELREMNSLENELKKYSNDPNYAMNIDYYLKNYEKIINKKKSRRPRKQVKKNN